MRYSNKIIKAFKNPYWALGVLIRHTPIGRWMSDSSFIKLEYFSGMKRYPNLKDPMTFNEKLQWLKLNDIHPEYERFVDKYEAKIAVGRIIGGGILYLP